MPTPILIDTDMGVDDAFAVALALSSNQLDLVGLVSVGGNVPVQQATHNIGRLLHGLKLPSPPAVGQGLDQTVGELKDARNVFGKDGLGEIDLPAADDFAADDYAEVYERLIGQYGSSLTIVAIGPLSNLARLLNDRQGLLEKAGKIIVLGGALWCPGNVTAETEFNFYRDPQAAKTVLSAGLPITVVPLDVSRQISIDESHAAHLARSGRRIGEILARMVQFPLQSETQDGPGTFQVHDALAVGILLWPEMFIKAKMSLEITVDGPAAGQCKPKVSKDKNQQLAVAISVNVVDFLENMLEQLCQEKFVV